jgi:PAS domain S-box-containing protein
VDDDTAGDRPVEAQAMAESALPGGEQVAPADVEPWEVSEQLLIAGLREHTLADHLRRQLAFSSAITSSLAEGVYALDRAGRITFVNPAAAQMLGWREAELIGRDAYVSVPVRGVHGTHAPAGAVPLVEVLRSGATYRNDDAVYTRKDGTSFPVAYSAAPIVIDAQVVGAVVAFRDMTEVQRLQQTQEEYLQLLSHDLRAPLSVILGHGQLLVGRLAREGLARDVMSAEEIVDSGLHMNRMIQDLLDRTLLEAGHSTLRRARVDLLQLVRRSVDENVTPVERARIRVDALAQPVVVADPGLIERVIVNLLTNAIKYSDPASPVVVRVFQAEQDAVIAIADQGVGIDADDFPHLFTKHFRAHTAGTTPGTGLGLYSSRLIVEAHGGRIWAESAAAMGSSFLFSLPLSDP